MTERVTRRITYRGPPSGASALVRALESEGARAEWDRPLEQRGTEHVEAIILSLVASGSDDAIRLGLQQFHDRFKDAGIEASIDDD